MGGGIKTTAKVATKPLSYCYESRASTESCTKDATTWTSYSGSDDEYDILGKALMLYNWGTGASGTAMVDRLRTEVATIKNGNFKQTHYGYLMAIKEKTWNYRPADGGYLPYRTYIWKGGTIDAKTTTDPNTGVVTTTPAQDWCFAFGERDWSSGTTFDDAKDYSEKYQLGIPKSGTTDYRTACP